MPKRKNRQIQFYLITIHSPLWFSWSNFFCKIAFFLSLKKKGFVLGRLYFYSWKAREIYLKRTRPPPSLLFVAVKWNENKQIEILKHFYNLALSFHKLYSQVVKRTTEKIKIIDSQYRLSVNGIMKYSLRWHFKAADHGLLRV